MGRPNQTHDRLDALLDGRPGEVTDDLAPLLAAAEALRTELAEFELDPEVVDRHIEQALDRPAKVVTLPVRTPGGGGSVLRRRLAAVGLAAALLIVPATAASAASSSALPGQALYPLKLAVEQFRLATVQWSPTREAQERAKLAAKRLAELDKLVQLRMFSQIPPAIRALDKAVLAANVALAEAAKAEGATDPELAEVVGTIAAVAVAQHGELVALKEMEGQLPRAITLAVKESPAALHPIAPSTLTPAPLTTLPPGPTDPPPATAAPPDTQPAPEPTSVPTTQPEPEPPVTTAPPVTDPPTTNPPTTTGPPPTTAGVEGTPEGAEGARTEGSPSSLGP
jgi:hypothetical protein